MLPGLYEIVMEADLYQECPYGGAYVIAWTFIRGEPERVFDMDSDGANHAAAVVLLLRRLMKNWPDQCRVAYKRDGGDDDGFEVLSKALAEPVEYLVRETLRRHMMLHAMPTDGQTTRALT